MNHEPPNTRLRLSREEMRALGYRVIDMLVEHVETLPEKPVTHAHQGARPRLEARLREPLPEQGTAPEAVLEQLQRDVFSHISHVDHPRFFAFIPSVIYYSDQTHSSIERGLRVLGFSSEQIRNLPSDDGFRLDVAALQKAVEEDRAAGRVPFCVIATAGTTNTGACSCASGAGSKRLFPSIPNTFRTRSAPRKRSTLPITASSLRVISARSSCGCRLKSSAWQRFGRPSRTAFAWPRPPSRWSGRGTIGRWSRRRRWRCSRSATPGRSSSELDALNLEIIATMFDDGFAMLTTSVLRGRVVIRLCPINPRTTEDDIRHTLERLDGFARALTA